MDKKCDGPFFKGAVIGSNRIHLRSGSADKKQLWLWKQREKSGSGRETQHCFSQSVTGGVFQPVTGQGIEWIRRRGRSFVWLLGSNIKEFTPLFLKNKYSFSKLITVTLLHRNPPLIIYLFLVNRVLFTSHLVHRMVRSVKITAVKVKWIPKY